MVSTPTATNKAPAVNHWRAWSSLPARMPGGLGRRVHHGHQNGLHTQVEVLFDQRSLAHGYANHGVRTRARQRTGGAGNGLQLPENRAQIVGRVLAVDHQPVIAGAGQNFSAIGVSQTQPQADLGLLVLQGLLEDVDRCFHVCCLFIGSARLGCARRSNGDSQRQAGQSLCCGTGPQAAQCCPKAPLRLEREDGDIDSLRPRGSPWIHPFAYSSINSAASCWRHWYP